MGHDSDAALADLASKPFFSRIWSGASPDFDSAEEVKLQDLGYKQARGAARAPARLARLGLPLNETTTSRL